MKVQRDGVMISAYVPPALAERLKAAARAEDRSMSSLLRRWVTEKLEAAEEPQKQAS